MKTEAGQRKLRVLVVASHAPWPLSHGGHLRLHHFLRELAPLADVTLVVPRPGPRDMELPENVRRVTPANDAAPRSRHSSRVGSWIARQMRSHFGTDAALQGWLNRHANRTRFDVTLLSGATTGVYAPVVRTPVVWDVVDELASAAMMQPKVTLVPRIKAAIRAALYERDVVAAGATALFAAPHDAAWARRWCGRRCLTISNGVDTEYFTRATRPPTPGTLAFVGGLSFPPNVDAISHFATTAWPLIHGRDRRRRLIIAGRAPDPAVQSLAALPGVELRPDLPDIRPILAEASAVIVPLRRGGGVKNKILEACAVGRPVIATPWACRGLGVCSGREVLCAATPAQWLRQVEWVQLHETAAAALAARGARWVREHHNWRVLARRLLVVLRDASNCPAASAPPSSAEQTQRHHVATPALRWPSRPGPVKAQDGRPDEISEMLPALVGTQE